jgi:mono/diheme cytochrome c family protein
MRNGMWRAATTWTIGAVLTTTVVQAFRPAFEPESPSATALQDHPQAPHRHPEAETLVNAAARTPESVKTGGLLYAKSCSSCHGPNGLGNGRLAAAMAAYGGRPSNLTDPDWQHGSSDGEIFVVIRDGVAPDFHMPKFEGKLSDEEMWHVVNYVRSLGP